VATPDSTFWVHSGPTGIRVRAVPMTLAHYDGRFHEVYVADVDRSFDDAVFTGERVYVRDLITGDSTLVYDDTAVTRLAAHHGLSHPDAVPLDVDDDPPSDPDVVAADETDVLEVRGPYVLLEHRSDFEHLGGELHDTVHTAMDHRSGRVITQSALIHLAAATADSIAVNPLPHTWKRADYTVLARGDSASGDISLSLRDRQKRLWPLFTVSSHARMYWLDKPPVDNVTRRALSHAFNEAASYDMATRFVRFDVPTPRRPLVTARFRQPATHTSPGIPRPPQRT
jgi:hypothetical protein